MSDWRAVSLGQIATYRKGIAYSAADYGHRQSGHPFITIKCFVKGGGYEARGIKFYEGVSAKRDHLAQGDVLFAATDLTRAGDIVGSPLRVPDFGSTKPPVASMDCVRIDPACEECDKDFLFHLLMLPYVRRQMIALSAGSTVLHLDTKRVAEIRLRIPTKTPTQRKIVKVLKSLDDVIEATEALIEKHRQIKAGLMHDLSTRGVLPGGQLRPARLEAPHLYRRTVLGWIPGDWDVDQLSERVEVVDPNPSHRYPEPIDDGVPLISTENFEGEDDIRIDNASRVPQRTFLAQNARCRFSPLDVVFARKGQIGLARRYGQEDKTFSHTVVILKPTRQTCDAAWLLWAARSAWLLNHIDRTMNSNSGVPTLGVAFIKAVPLPFPPAAEQQQIAAVLDAATGRINSLVANLRKLRTQRLGLMRDLLTGKVAIKVPEPAIPA